MTIDEKKWQIIEIMESAIKQNTKLFVFIAFETSTGIASTDLNMNMNVLEVRGLASVINDHVSAKLEKIKMDTVPLGTENKILQ